MSSVPVLFDANGSMGKKSNSPPDFPTVRDRLAFMDRHGIARSLVWNVESGQNHAGASNRKLLDQIASTPGAAGRIIPALSVSGLMAYEAGAVEELDAMMKASGTRALRFQNVFSRLTLRQLEPVIKRLLKRKPFIVMRFDQTTPQDLLDFTERFPSVPVVLTEVMWGPCITVFDLMRQRKNILCDNSWLHTWEGIETVVRHFGADRLVFGTGYRSQNGAAIGALARAQVTAAQRRLIASGNLERLCGLKPCKPVAPRIHEGNTLWNRFLDGRPLGVEVIDAHGHLGPSGGYVLEAQYGDKQIPKALANMDSLGIGTMIFSGLEALMGGPVEGNDLLESVCRRAPGRFLGYVAFNPLYADELVPHLDRWFKGGFYCGFKTLCDYWGMPITDSRFKPMWEYANRHRLPVLNHTWNGGNDSPALFKDLVRKYPDVAFLLGHSGGGDPGRREAEELAKASKNVYLEWCGTFCSTIPWEESLKTVDVKQVVYGTDAMAHGTDWELGRLLSLDAPDSTLIPILGANMRRILSRRR